jgi:hypothetical protein
MILSYSEVQEALLPTIIDGIIVGCKNNEPINRAYICIENGGEESVSTAQGEFKISSPQKFPVTLLISHIQFITVRVAVTACKQPILVFLKEK